MLETSLQERGQTPHLRNAFGILDNYIFGELSSSDRRNKWGQNVFLLSLGSTVAYFHTLIYIDIRNVRGFWLLYRKILCVISMYLLLLVKVLVCFVPLYWHDLLQSVAPLFMLPTWFPNWFCYFITGCVNHPRCPLLVRTGYGKIRGKPTCSIYYPKWLYVYDITS